MPSPCPHCGYKDGFLIYGQATGRALVYYDGDGQYEETDFDKVYARQSQVIRCQGCRKVRRDVIYTDDHTIGDATHAG